MTMPRTFEYLLNAMEHASQADHPDKMGYAEKRRAVFQHVEDLWDDYMRLLREKQDRLAAVVPEDAPTDSGRAKAFKDAMHSYLDAAKVEKARAERAEAALRAILPFIDDAADVQNIFHDSAASKGCRAAVEEAHAVLAASPQFIPQRDSQSEEK